MTRDLKHRAPSGKTHRERRGRTSLILGGLILLGAGALGLATKQFSSPTPPPAKPEEPAVLGGDSSPFTYFRMLEDRERQVDETEIQHDARSIRNGRTSTQGRFSLLLGTYRTREEAEGVRQDVRRYEPLSPQGERIHLQFSTWYRVTLGPYGQLSDAVKVRQFLRAQGQDSIITTPLFNQDEIKESP